MNAVNQKLRLIKRILRLIEDDFELTLLLQGDNEELVDYEKTMVMYVYLEVIQYIMNMAEISENIHAMRVYMTPADHIQHVELHSSPLPRINRKTGFLCGMAGYF